MWRSKGMHDVQNVGLPMWKLKLFWRRISGEERKGRKAMGSREEVMDNLLYQYLGTTTSGTIIALI